MIRKVPLMFFALAAFLAVTPLFHQHPLNAASESSTNASTATCVMCAAGVHRLPAAAPTVSVPVSLSYAIRAFVVVTLSHGVPLALPSRAPPAA